MHEVDVAHQAKEQSLSIRQLSTMQVDAHFGYWRHLRKKERNVLSWSGLEKVQGWNGAKVQLQHVLEMARVKKGDKRAEVWTMPGTHLRSKQGQRPSNQCNRSEGQNKHKRGTYERSRGVAGCDPLKLCAKLRFPPAPPPAPPNCLPALGSPPLKGMPPKAHPELLPPTNRYY